MSPAEIDPLHGPQPNYTRRAALQALTALGVGSATFRRALAAQVQAGIKITSGMVAEAEWVAGIELGEDEREDVASSMERSLANARRLRELPVDADQVPALVFRPDFFYQAAANAEPTGSSADQASTTPAERASTSATAATNSIGWSRRDVGQYSDEELAFAGIIDQASLLADQRISSRELAELYLARLKKYDPLLLCVVSQLEESALEQADSSDRRRVRGETKGILDGIPWLAKDLIAVPPWKTTWGAEPFKDQVRKTTATVARKLNAAGAVLLAKTTLGALAWGDQWFGGMTRNPWNPEQGSSGSSAGSASAIAAGLGTFALGSETLGSIVSPCRRCRTSGLRPNFGRVSRAGCMPLAWSMDKIGPIARYCEDLAYVFAALTGIDGKDPTLVERPFNWPLTTKLKTLRIGVTGEELNAIEQQALDYFMSEGATPVEVDLSTSLPENAMSFILGTEASTVFDDAFRVDRKADYGKWPSTFRQSQFVPAIQYLRANRLRSQLISEAEAKFSTVDIVLGGNDLLLTNLSGHPSLVVACGADQSDGIKLPGVVKLTSAAYQEEKLLLAGKALQLSLPATPSKPPLDSWMEKQQSRSEAADQSQ